MENDYKCAVESECKRSCETAIMEEITNSFDNEGSVDIMTDARHGHRKNAKDSNIICKLYGPLGQMWPRPEWSLVSIDLL